MKSVFYYNEPFLLESGSILPSIQLAYTSYGQLNEDKTNVVWIFHALTGNSDPKEWWPGLVGEGKIIDPNKYFIICVNKPGSPYGSISPITVNPITEDLYYHSFPFFTIKDMTKAYQLLKNSLGIQKIFLSIGGSTGGMQCLEWAIEEPHLFETIIPIASNAYMSPWGIAFNASQRMAIEADASWTLPKLDTGLKGLAAARSIALLSYRHYDGYAITQQRNRQFTGMSDEVHFAADNYQRYQGIKLVGRYNVVCYYKLTQSMDSHDVGKNRGGAENALSKIKAKTLVIGVDSDVLYPFSEQEYLQKYIPHAALVKINSHFGHDGFLVEFDQLNTAIENFINSLKH